jgi:hypothetical protein
VVEAVAVEVVTDDLIRSVDAGPREGKLLLLDPFFSTSGRPVSISMTQHFLHAIIDAKVGGRFTCAPFQRLLPEAAAAAARELIRTRAPTVTRNGLQQRPPVIVRSAARRS